MGDINIVAAGTLAAFEYKQATADDVPLIISSPHSGRNYPSDFKYKCDKEQLRRLEDLYVDQLTQGLDEKGAHLLNALFPRSYIDPNRPRDCLDPRQIKGGLRTLPYEKTGMYRKFLKHETGLIFMRSEISHFQIYGRDKRSRPNENDIMKRLPLWDAYHEKLSGLFNDLGQKHKDVYLLDMHSCWRYGAKEILGIRKRRADVVLSDNKGVTCSKEFMDVAYHAFKKHGLEVKMNRPFKGGYIVNHYGNPDQHRHALQIEIVRDLYLDEKTLELDPARTKKLQSVIGSVTNTLADYIRVHEREI